MDDNLKRYVRQQCNNSVDPKIVRYNLVTAGWNSQQVDSAIMKIYPKKDLHISRGNPHLLRALVVVIAIILGAMVIVYTQVINDNPVYNPSPNPSPNPTPNPAPIQMKACADISNSVDKDACYYNEVGEGFDCDELADDIERNFCFRALDRYIMAY